MSRHKLTSATPNEELKKKLRAVIADMRSNAIMTNKELQAIEKEIANPNSLISTNTLNAYVHHTTFHPIPRELKTGWDRLEPFMHKLWHG